MEESLKEFIHMPKELPQNQTSTEEFISLILDNTGEDLRWFFEHYLYKNELPTLMVEEKIIKGKKFIDLWWKDDGFIMPVEISFNSFDGKRERKMELTNSPTRIAIPKKSKLKIDPNDWLLYRLHEEKK